jgi:hypothetical protein
MKWNSGNIFWTIVCLISYFLAIWVFVDNIRVIADRAKEHYPSFEWDRASDLHKGAAIVYFGLWTVAFIVLVILSLKNLLKKRKSRAGIYAIVIILLFLVSNFVDTLLHHMY